MDRSSQGKNTESHNRKTTLAKYTAPGQVQGVKSYSRKGKARGRTEYSLSHKSKVLQTIRNAKWNTYRKAIRNGFSKEVATKKGELAAINKRAELSSSLCPPSHQSQNWKNIYHPDLGGMFTLFLTANLMSSYWPMVTDLIQVSWGQILVKDGGQFAVIQYEWVTRVEGLVYQGVI